MVKKPNAKPSSSSVTLAKKESGKIRQRDEVVEEKVPEKQQQTQQPAFTPRDEQRKQEASSSFSSSSPPTATTNVNLLLLNLNSNAEQIYRQTLGKMMVSTFPQLARQLQQQQQQQAITEEKTSDSKKDDKRKTPTTTTTAAARTTDGDSKEATHKNHQQQHQHQPTPQFNLSAQQASFFPEDQQSATMLIRFSDKSAAKKFAHKVNHITGLFGSVGSHAYVVPTASLKPKYEPCALRITELSVSASAATGGNSTNTNDDIIAGNSSFSLQQLQQYLSSNPGFLSVSRVATTTTANSSSSNKAASSSAAANRCFIATYADSGAALQSRALMSGRAFHGTHLLFERIVEESEQIVPLA